MATRNSREIFQQRKSLSRFFPSTPRSRYYDMHKKHFLYGRIDRDGDAIYLDVPLKQVRSGPGTTHFAVDFVADAFSDLRAYYGDRITGGFISRESLYGPELSVKRSHWGNSQEFTYLAYTNRIYSNFVQVHLKKNRRFEKIKNFKDYVREFVSYMRGIARNFPLTKTGFLTSIHSSPYVGGLSLAISTADHGDRSDLNLRRFVQDPNFSYMSELCVKFGFMLDRNAPWRLVFNLASGNLSEDKNNPTGGLRYMRRQGVDFENVFSVYYSKAYLAELNNMKNLLDSHYVAFHKQYVVFDELLQVPREGGSCANPRVIRAQRRRGTPLTQAELDSPEIEEYILKILLLLRMTESSHKDIDSIYSRKAYEMIQAYRNLGEEAALRYINNLTKGWSVSKLTRSGKYWYGQGQKEYNERIKNSIENVGSSNAPITGVKNTF